MDIKNNKASEFLNLRGIEYFLFEEDFIEENVRCIPMIVRFKMDAAGIKLKLSEWSKFSVDERKALAIMPCGIEGERESYHNYLDGLVKKYTGEAASKMEIDSKPQWSHLKQVPHALQEKASEFNWKISVAQWQRLTNLQRFALLKLQRPGHENKNFPIAMQEFKLVPENLQIVEEAIASTAAFGRIINRHEFMNSELEKTPNT